MLFTEKLTKKYGDFTALAGVSISVPKGQCCGILGPNGAGKSTLFRILMGFLKPSSGFAEINQKNCTTQSVEVHRQVAYLPGDVRLPGFMKGKSVLKFFAEVHPAGNFQRAIDVADRLDLNLTRRVAFMSTGMRQKLGLCIVLSNHAPLTILDEPTTSLDPNVRQEVVQMIHEANQRGQTIVICSHVLSEIEDICSRAIIMRSGQVVHDQDLQLLQNQHEITCRVSGAAPQLPDSINQVVKNFSCDDGLIKISTNGDLSPIIPWLHEMNVAQLKIKQSSLKSIYQQYHHAVVQA